MKLYVVDYIEYVVNFSDDFEETHKIVGVFDDLEKAVEAIVEKGFEPYNYDFVDDSEYLEGGVLFVSDEKRDEEIMLYLRHSNEPIWPIE